MNLTEFTGILVHNYSQRWHLQVCKGGDDKGPAILPVQNSCDFFLSPTDLFFSKDGKFFDKRKLSSPW